MEKDIEIGKLNEIYEKYGDLGFKVDTPYGYHNISWCGITEENAEVYRCELEDGKYVEGADQHRLKNEDGEFIILKDVEIGEPIQTIDGVSKVRSVKLLNEKDTLYDIQVDNVHQYYSNGIVSHNTTLIIDAVKFLFFGKTTKTDKNIEIFNQFNEEEDLIVRGMITIDGGLEVIIERHLTRKKKRTTGWNVTNKLNYYTILPDGEEKLMNEEDAIRTTKSIASIVGDEKDFDLMVLATSKNLDNLIDSKSTESGKLLTKFIGLEVLSKKEDIARRMYNTYAKTMKSNIYDVITLSDEIKVHTESVIRLKENEVLINDSLVNANNLLTNLNNDKIRLISSKDKIDVEIITLNPSKINGEITEITEKGKEISKTISDLEKEIEGIGVVEFDEENDFNLNANKNDYNARLKINESELIKKESELKMLIDSGICQSCNRVLDDVDNTEHVNKVNVDIADIKVDIEDLEIKINITTIELTKLSDSKKLVDYKNRLELKKDRLEVQVGSLRNDLRGKKTDLKVYNDNINSIDKNKSIDSEISLVDTKLKVSSTEIDRLNSELRTNTVTLSKDLDSIDSKEILISKINKEKITEKLFKVYIDMVGKKGISKIILRSTLPIINGELQMLLDDITDFDVEVVINDKNEVGYLLVKDGVEKPLKSGSGFELTTASIALRSVLGKMSSLPKPNFVVFDEVMGRVASENIPKMKPLFDRVSDMFDIVFFITQDDTFKDWATNIVTVIKEDNISKLK